MFVKDNQDGSDKTRIDYLGFIGTPVNATNMADFKRVSVYHYIPDTVRCAFQQNSLNTWTEKIVATENFRFVF